ncbi:heat shock [Cymbomonas tetramitiformis]|uniref:Heat shock n=1 Tax=Cymbomonas tetramitiformis TaxID=36881 RepID=A0AAE0BRX6_9CHLO|nr:heat shock [Cymbomonas tetramitiformis]
MPTCDVVVGIDLGTTNSAVAVIDRGLPKIVTIDDGNRTMPSVVHYGKEGTVSVGRAAQQKQMHDPENVIHSAKRFMGRSSEDTAEDAKNVAFKTTADEEDFSMIFAPALGETLYPEEVAGEILRKILRDAEAELNEEITKAVIAVPAYFDDMQREATEIAGRAAGLDKVKLLREPQAAALAYGVRKEEDATILVFDLGGGTFDVSILEVGGGAIEVLSTGGDAHLGGNDFDSVVMEWILEEAGKSRANATVDTGNTDVMNTLTAASRALRERISEKGQATLRLPMFGADFKVTLTRNNLECLSADLLRRMRLPVEHAALQAGVDLDAHRKIDTQRDGRKKGKAAISRRRRPGAGCWMRCCWWGRHAHACCAALVENMTGLSPRLSAVDPDEAVALGAAVQAGVLEGTMGGLAVMDVWQASLMRAVAANQLKEMERAGVDGDTEGLFGETENGNNESDECA